MTTTKKKILLAIVLGVFAVVAALVYYSHHSENSLSVSSKPAQPSDFVGTWIREDSNNFDNVTLTITNPTETGFTFALDAQSGAHSGTWSNYDQEKKLPVGTLVLSGRTAHYADDPTDSLYQNEDGTVNPPCTGDFVLSGDDAVLTFATNCSEIYAGFGVSFEGTFRKDVTIAQASIKDADVFAEYPGTYAAFAKLVGAHLDTFNQTIAMESNDDYVDPELGDVSGSTFAVPHAFTELESIVITNSHDAVWAAVIDWDDADQQSIVRYFTTEPAWKDKLPKMITDWKQDFDDYPVIYESK